MGGSDPALVELSFVSRLADGLPVAAMLRIERQVQQFNRQHGITGQMRVSGRTIRQVIEGSCSVVMPLAARILTDHRHEAISVLAFRPIEARRFRDWSATGLDSGLVPAILACTSSTKLRLLPLAAARTLAEPSELDARTGAP